MKKKNLKSLKLNKKSISHLSNEKNSIVGGTGTLVSCPGVGICGIQTDNGCDPGGTNSCPTMNCGPTEGCETASCPGNGICA
ncbi:hypothetical protein GTQ40_00505 [Flavobacteriaceae bacterium R38]|nr:hypothetical protein [Flavobacteriaceae bacterium R38]